MKKKITRSLVPAAVSAPDCIKPHAASSGDLSALFADTALKDPATEPSIAQIVGWSWHQAQDGLRSIVEFGALLLQVEAWLKARPGPNKKAGERGGLKAWLAAHVPCVCYTTAIGYREAAKGLIAAVRLAADRPLLPLMGENPLTDEEDAALQKKVFEVIASSSLRLLKAAAKAAGPARDPADRNQGRHPKGAEEGVEEALDRAAALAAADTALADGEMAERLQPLHVWAVENDGVGTLSDKGLDMLLDGIGEIRDRALAVRKARAAAARREARA